MTSPSQVFALLYGRPGAIWLDGGDPGPWSIISWDPVETLTSAEDWPAHARSMQKKSAATVQPFSSGLIGYLAYGAGHVVESVPTEPSTDEPPLWLSRFEGAMCYRHRDSRWFISGPRSFREQAERLLSAPVFTPSPPSKISYQTIARAEYLNKVQKIQRWINDGDCYQVNLSRVIVATGVRRPYSLYQRVRRGSRPAFGAYLCLSEHLSILSNSPESFLSFDGNTVRSEPIKGTAPRQDDPDRDQQMKDWLLASKKDKAELAMIVDLIRNDLGRVAQPGSVTVGPRRVLSHANVHHAHQTVCAQLRPGHDPWSTIASAFPPGSVTGAPKIRACERIAQLEREPRGVYCGSIGYLDDSGRGQWSVAIRTGVWTPARFRYHVGGGIVHDSSPEREWQETVQKGSVWAEALGLSSD